MLKLDGLFAFVITGRRLKETTANKNFEFLFRIISYGVSVCGLLSLVASGSVGIPITLVFILLIIGAWFLEDSGWQLSEKLGVAVIFLALPLLYLDWKHDLFGFGYKDVVGGGSLARLILVLAGIKLLQKKNDRDWIFIYLISFFQILLAAGMSISPLYLASLIVYLLFASSAVIAFEMRKTARGVSEGKTDASGSVRKAQRAFEKFRLSRLPVVSVLLLTAVAAIAIPMFFVLPRVGGANIGANPGGVSSLTGFSDSVRLGELGTLLQSDEKVMRVRFEPDGKGLPAPLRWRGIALDFFDKKSWRRSKFGPQENVPKGDRNVFVIDTSRNPDNLLAQTIYLEPLDTPVLFSLARPVIVQGGFDTLGKDPEGSISLTRPNFERISYKVYSDPVLPAENELRADSGDYAPSQRRYLQVPPNLDRRIGELAADVIEKSGADNNYDRARAIESYLTGNFDYSLEMKAGGDDPIADFLFNIRAGHCEYFASAMALMLRTQGVATRIVNGFHGGQYNETADVYVIAQKDAHSWVEVYFPDRKIWVPFDPTPAATGIDQSGGRITFAGGLNKYVEALETFWIQYVVTYDNQEQRSLFRSIRGNASNAQAKASSWLADVKDKLSEWWKRARGDYGADTSYVAIAWGVAYLTATATAIFFALFLFRRAQRLKIWQWASRFLKGNKRDSVVEFYERMQKILAKKGFNRLPHQTPLEFVSELNMREAVMITERYNYVRFGGNDLSSEEARDVEDWLMDLKKNEK